MKKTSINALLLLIALSIPAFNISAQEYKEGVNYIKLPKPVETNDPSKVEVLELFSYGCPHCNSFEPDLNQWRKTKPSNVYFTRVPVSFGRQVWQTYSQAYYTAEILGVLDKTHTAFFKAIHSEKKKLGDEKSVRQFFMDNGISGDDFESIFNSFAVDTKLRRADNVLTYYSANSVPTMIVNGKYRVDSSLTNHNNQEMLKVVDFLIKKESNKK